MARTANATLEITLSVQSRALLNELAKRGIFGRHFRCVAARFVDAALEKHTDFPKLKLPRRRS